MLKKNILYLLLLLSFTLPAQEFSRIDSLDNQLKQLSQSVPQLDEKIEVDLSNTSLPNFLKAISKLHDLNLDISPQLSGITVINNFTNVKIKDLLVYLAEQYNLNFQFTGNIITISPYTPPETPYKPRKIPVTYNASQNIISLDLRNDSLKVVFRKITDVSGKNLVFAPGMENIKLSAYMQQVNFSSAMEKLAMSNHMTVKQSKDRFYIFNRKGKPIEGAEVFQPIGSSSENFYYKVLDSLNRVVKIDFEKVPAKDVILSISEDLGLDIFIASDLDHLGKVTISAESIPFDTLLDKIFESLNPNNSAPQKENQQNTINRNPTAPQNQEIVSTNYTYRKEDDIYYFGTESQLSLKSVELITMHYRSIELLSNPSGDYRQRRNNRNSMMSGMTNYYGNNNYSNPNTSYNSSSRQSLPTSNSPDKEDQKKAILDIIPEDIRGDLNIKIDSELNSFVVSGPSARIKRFKEFVKFIDKPVPVILIEVMILEVNKSATVETGVSFGLGDEPVQTSGQAFPSANMKLGAQTVNRIIGGFDGFGSLNIGRVLPNFYMDIKAMESNGNIKILSTPKLSTINGHKAHLSSGQTTYYAVTNQNYFGSQIPQTSEITNYYPIDAELALDIMPFVSGDGEITLDINVVQSNFNGERIAEEAPPGMNSREFSSIIRMRDQDVAILGGIEQRTKDDSGSGVPVLARIPVLKWLFSNRKREDSKKKLNILIKPTVIY